MFTPRINEMSEVHENFLELNFLAQFEPLGWIFEKKSNSIRQFISSYAFLSSQLGLNQINVKLS